MDINDNPPNPSPKDAVEWNGATESYQSGTKKDGTPKMSTRPAQGSWKRTTYTDYDKETTVSMALSYRILSGDREQVLRTDKSFQDTARDKAQYSEYTGDFTKLYEFVSQAETAEGGQMTTMGDKIKADKFQAKAKSIKSAEQLTGDCMNSVINQMGTDIFDALKGM